jgi:hypothetical protein
MAQDKKNIAAQQKNRHCRNCDKTNIGDSHSCHILSEKTNLHDILYIKYPKIAIGI